MSPHKLVKNVLVSIVGRTSVPGVTRIARVSWVTLISDIPQIPEMFVNDHILIQLTDIAASELVDMRIVELPHRRSIQIMQKATTNKSNWIATRIIDVICHLIPFCFHNQSGSIATKL